MSSPERERRRDKRLQLALPVRFSNQGEDSLSQILGMTRNVSSGGVYFEAPRGHVEAGDVVWLRIGVQSRDAEDDFSELTLVGSGVVRRVEPLSSGEYPEEVAPEGISGVALQFQQRPTIRLRSLERFLKANDEK